MVQSKTFVRINLKGLKSQPLPTQRLIKSFVVNGKVYVNDCNDRYAEISKNEIDGMILGCAVIDVRLLSEN